ncbi:hypothetical protein L484_021885 [Morus notabilis]|uniref:Uncharacterized protein n=1 Tax=Morus notabilis TaxID=981085 RepID=W9SBY7_9ROSA|nr:hypothetical protein L484_021885 [Morus notabilis]
MMTEEEEDKNHRIAIISLHGTSLHIPNRSPKNTLVEAPPPSISRSPKLANNFFQLTLPTTVRTRAPNRNPPDK